MNKRNIDWNNYEEDFKKLFAERDLKDAKSGSIAYIKNIDKLTTWKIYHTHWENWLSSSEYFKNWWERINNFQTEKEVDFYTSRLRAFIEFVQEHTRKDIRHVEDAKPWDPVKTPQLIEQELKRLKNISEEEFNKTDKWRKNGPVFKELSVEEMKNDPWFSEQLGFGSKNKQEEQENKENDNKNADYQTWTKDQLISEINRLKAENEELKNNQSLASSERQKRLQQNQQKLEKLELSILNSCSDDTNKGTIVLICGAVVLLGLLAYLVIKPKNSKKYLK